MTAPTKGDYQRDTLQALLETKALAHMLMHEASDEGDDGLRWSHDKCQRISDALELLNRRLDEGLVAFDRATSKECGP